MPSFASMGRSACSNNTALTPSRSETLTSVQSSQLPDRHRLVVAPDRDFAERHGVAAVLAEHIMHARGDEELRVEVLVGGPQPRGKIHGIADHGIFLAPGRADIAGDHLAE